MMASSCGRYAPRNARMSDDTHSWIWSNSSSSAAFSSSSASRSCGQTRSQLSRTAFERTRAAAAAAALGPGCMGGGAGSSVPPGARGTGLEVPPAPRRQSPRASCARAASRAARCCSSAGAPAPPSAPPAPPPRSAAQAAFIRARGRQTGGLPGRAICSALSISVPAAAAISASALSIPDARSASVSCSNTREHARTRANTGHNNWRQIFSPREQATKRGAVAAGARAVTLQAGPCARRAHTRGWERKPRPPAPPQG